MLTFAALPNIEYATALAQAYNRWLMEEWLLKEPGLYGVMLANAAEPGGGGAGDRGLRQRGAHRRYLSADRRGQPPGGHRIYDPIMAAADATGLPVCLHSVTLVSPAFPCQLDQFENHFATGPLHSFAMMANLTSLIHSGVPAASPICESSSPRRGSPGCPT